jgi:hypothetical protein
MVRTEPLLQEVSAHAHRPDVTPDRNRLPRHCLTLPYGMAALQRKLAAKTNSSPSSILESARATHCGAPHVGQQSQPKVGANVGERISPDSKQQSVNMFFTCGGPASRLSSTLSNASHKKWRFANAWPEPDFKYLSNRAATASVLNSTHTSTTHGFQRAVDGF